VRSLELALAAALLVVVFVSTTGQVHTRGGLLPSQGGNAGKFLTTNGASASWERIAVASPEFFSVYEDFLIAHGPLTQNAVNPFPEYRWRFMGNNGGTVTRVTDPRGVLDILGSALGNSGVTLVDDAGTDVALIATAVMEPVVLFRVGVRGTGGSGTETTTTRRIGLMSGFAAFPPNEPPDDGIYVQFVFGNYFGVCRASNTETTLDLGVASANAVMDRFEIRATPTSVTFLVNSANRGTISTNIPAASLGLMAFHEPNGVNASNSGLRVDYLGLRAVR
jgi:hypothetical protein